KLLTCFSIYILLIWGMAFSSQYWAGNTNYPSSMTMPFPGPLKKRFHLGSLTCSVMLYTSVQVCPSSLLLTSTNWPVSSGDNPGLEPAMDRLPLLHNAATQIVFVAGSNNTEGSPTPLFSCGAPISIMICIGSQVRPPSVLRLIPTSILPGRSLELSYRMS